MDVPGTQLFDAIKHADPEAAAAVLSADPSVANARDESGVSAVMLAMYYRQPEIAEAIAAARERLDVFEAVALDRGETVREHVGSDEFDLEARTPDGFTALHYAAFFDRPDLVVLLLSAGAQVDAVANNPMRVQPLHSAVAAGSLESVRLLLEADAPVDARQERGFTPLQGASHAGNVAMVRCLLDAGADPDLQNDDGKSARDFAAEGGHADVAALFAS